MKKPNPSVSSRTKNKSALQRFSSKNNRLLIIFVVIFAVIGVYAVIKSFASPVVVAKYEAETASLPAGATVITDANASATKAMKLTQNGAVTASINLPAAVTSLTVTSRGDQCSGSPTMSMAIDGANILQSSVTSTSYASYTATVNIAAGTHSFKIQADNLGTSSKGKSKKSCSRILYLDVLTFYGADVPATPVPTVSLSATPASVNSGETSTLTWSSTNAASCVASGGWSGTKALSGTEVTPALTASTSYSLNCSNTTGTGTASTTVTVSSVTPPPPSPPPTSGTPMPLGVSGAWTLAFSDEFNGTSLDTTKWSPNWFGDGGSMNNVGTYASNVSVSNGNLNLQLSSSTAGALVHTDYSAGRYQLPVGSYTEARIYFPGSSTEQWYNWPAWWASGPSWPSAGEHDIAEGLGGSPTVNYHSPSGSHNQGTIAGTWNNAFHTYGLWRKATSAEVYWDGKLVKSYPTDDNGAGEELILNVGASGSRTAQLGTAGRVMVDYVRAWKP